MRTHTGEDPELNQTRTQSQAKQDDWPEEIQKKCSIKVILFAWFFILACEEFNDSCDTSMCGGRVDGWLGLAARGNRMLVSVSVCVCVCVIRDSVCVCVIRDSVCVLS